jgi:hypothetical protein
MAFTQGRYQPDVLRGPQWRPAPLTGIRMAGAGIECLRLTAAQGAQRPGAGGGIPSPGGWMSERPPASPDGLRTPVSPPNRA